jgi:hypothetical protein
LTGLMILGVETNTEKGLGRVERSTEKGLGRKRMPGRGIGTGTKTGPVITAMSTAMTLGVGAFIGSLRRGIGT